MRELFALGSNGVIYRSVRHAAGCIHCLFSPSADRQRALSGGRFEYRWRGTRTL